MVVYYHLITRACQHCGRCFTCTAPHHSCSTSLALTPLQRQALGVVGATGAQQAATLPASLKKIVGAFQMVPDPMARYKQLLYYANKLPALPAEDHVPGNKVEGCVSQVCVGGGLG